VGFWKFGFCLLVFAVKNLQNLQYNSIAPSTKAKMPRVRSSQRLLLSTVVENSSHHVKRTALEIENNQGEPTRKRAALGDLTNVRAVCIFAILLEILPFFQFQKFSLTVLRTPKANVDTPPPTPYDAAPDVDYDAECLSDPFQVPHYAMDIFRYYRTREVG
jgi:hypothetical protein